MLGFPDFLAPQKDNDLMRTISPLIALICCTIMACSGGSSGGTTTTDEGTTDEGTTDEGTTDEGTTTGCAVLNDDDDTITFQEAIELDGLSHTHGAMAATDAAVHACSGNKVISFDPCMAETPTETDLGGSCKAIGTRGDTVVVSSDDGKWQLLTGDNNTGPSARTLRINETHIFAALGVDGVATAPIDLSAAATSYAIGTDVRDTLPMAGGLVIGNGIHGLSWATLKDGVPLLTATKLELTGTVMGLTPITEKRFIVTLTGNGIAVIDVDDNGLNIVGELDTPGLASAVAVNAAGYALVADWNALRLIDMSDPAKMKIIARENFGTGKLGAEASPNQLGRALGIVSVGNTWIALGLNAVTRVDINPDIQVAELSLANSLIQISVMPGESGSTGLLFPNTGRMALEVNNIQPGDSRIAITDLFGSSEKEGVDMFVEPGDTGFIALGAEGKAGLETTISFTTNDPDNATVSIPVVINPLLVDKNDTAPDFVAPSVDGQMIRLSGLKGQVVYMKLFNGL